MGIMQRSTLKRSNDSTRIVITALMGIAFGVCIGISISSAHLSKISLLSGVKNSFDVPMSEIGRSHPFIESSSGTKHIEALGSASLSKINASSNPRGAESLPPGIVVSESDLYLRRLWGDPSEVYDKNSYLLCKKLFVAYIIFTFSSHIVELHYYKYD